MELKLGTKIKCNGVILKVVENNPDEEGIFCHGCYFRGKQCYYNEDKKKLGYCSEKDRSDNRNVKFVRVEDVEDYWQRQRLKIAKLMLPVTANFEKLSCNGITTLRVSPSEAAKFAISYADALITELKKEEYEEDNYLRMQ